jgi:hypothetical protein
MNWFKMKNRTLLLLFFLPSMIESVHAQSAGGKSGIKPDTINPVKGNPQEQLKEIKEKKNEIFSDSVANIPKQGIPVDTTTFNRYGDLLNDDTAYNKKSPIWIPATEVIGILGATWAIDRYVLNADYAHTGAKTWKRNFKEGWEWDADKFGINFIGHPYSGALSFNAGRSLGHNFSTSFGLSVLGSVFWEYFGENTRPSYNDLINTPVSGAFLGEVLYRISSNILDDRTRGMHRVIREITAGIVNPVRGINRLLDGKAFRVTNKEVYQEEPLNISLLAGIQQRNLYVNSDLGKGSPNPALNLQLDYGNAFENRSRKPFDFFRLRVDLSFGYGKKMIDNVVGYGLLAGKNAGKKKSGSLIGIFQHYDYWDNYSFEMGALALGPGAITQYEFKTLGLENHLYTNFHLGFVPLAGKSGAQGVDPHTDTRDYNFGWGGESKLEVALNIGNVTTLALAGYYYYLQTYEGLTEKTSLAILKPKIYFTVYRNIKVGYEQTVQYDKSVSNTTSGNYNRHMEQKAFILIYLEDKQRKGRYN